MTIADPPYQPASLAARPARGLNARYLVALGFIAALVLLGQIIVEPALLRLAVDAPTINLAGRQRMLSQRLAKAALALEREGEPEDQRPYLAELEQVAREWTAAHDRLRAGVASDGSYRTERAKLHEAFAALQPEYDRMQAATIRLLQAHAEPALDRTRGDTSARESVTAILAAEPVYLVRMEHVVSLYESAARSHVRRLVNLGRVLAALALLALGGVWLFILRPAAQLIERQLEALQESQQALEARVRERTGELEAANARVEHVAAERAQAQAQQREALALASHAARTSTLGEMASALAHELNQPLGAIANYAEGCLVELQKEPPNLAEIQSALEHLRAATLRAGEVIKRIRRFVTRRPAECAPFDANRAVAEVAELLSDEARKRRITLETDLAPDLPYLSGDVVQIQQVLINLARNGFEAIDATETAERTVLMQTRRAGQQAVEMRVTDSGEGIPSDRLDRIFDAYFSTRVEGMGMGLAISRTIVEAHQGTLTVESEPGVATTFRFRLPCVGMEHDAGPNRLRC